MKVLVTGANGFIGKNLCLWLKNKGYEVFEFDIGSTDEDLKNYVSSCNFIVHLAGVNRPLDPKEFLDGNVNFTKKLLDIIESTGSKAPIIFSSSTQAELDNPYGRSKKMAEDQLLEFGKQGHQVYVYRLYNVFGKWCKPNYNSVIATWCYNVIHGIPLEVNEKAPAIDFVYIDDVVSEFLKTIGTPPVSKECFLHVEPHFSETLSSVANALISFKESRENLTIPNVEGGFLKDLYSTYLSYIEVDFSYNLESHRDERGSFTEIFKTLQNGQISINIAHPGILKGNHYHMSKCEKYLVISGVCEIKLRRIDTDNVISYICSGENLKIIDIPPGFVHSIKNIGAQDSAIIMWANEVFDEGSPDTFFMDVETNRSKQQNEMNRKAD
jgi:UDP-2-acetamido-2,6-beta-L-arabino-hexul-4-ose reductase